MNYIKNNYIHYFLITFLIIQLINAKNIRLDVDVDKEFEGDDVTTICINEKCYGNNSIEDTVSKKKIYFKTVLLNLMDELLLPLHVNDGGDVNPHRKCNMYFILFYITIFLITYNN